MKFGGVREVWMPALFKFEGRRKHCGRMGLMGRAMRIRRLDRVSYSILYRYLSVVVLALLFLLLYHQRKATKIRYATQAVYTYLYT